MDKKFINLMAKLKAMDQKRGTIRDYVESEYIDQDGDAILNVELKTADNLFSPYSGKKVLNPELMHYIDSQADPLPAYLPLVVNFIVNDISDADQDYIRKAFKRYYWLSYRSMVRDLRRLTLTSGLLFLAGVGILVLYYLLDRYNIDVFANEIILIASWVFIWEAVSRFFFNRRKKQVDLLNEGQMAVATVRFEVRPKKKKIVPQEVQP